MTRRAPPPMPAPVADRAATLQARGHVAYWIVVGYQDGLDLLAGRVPAAVRAQLLTTLKRARAEGAAEYAARIAEAATDDDVAARGDRRDGALRPLRGAVLLAGTPVARVVLPRVRRVLAARAARRASAPRRRRPAGAGRARAPDAGASRSRGSRGW